jgi:hypothetical protein
MTTKEGPMRNGKDHSDAAPEPERDFDLSRLRLSQDFAGLVGVKKALLTVPVRKPHRQAFVRVHPSEGYRFAAAVVEIDDDRIHYLVDPALAPELPGEVTPKMMFTTVDRQGTVFLWPIRLPGADGRLDDWNRVALEAAQIATTKWIRLVANMSLRTYDVLEATADLPAPEWPDIGFPELMKIAFRGRVIDNLDHPALRKLRGAI